MEVKPLQHKVSEAQKRSVECPQCGARPEKPCRASKRNMSRWQPGTLYLDTAHTERRTKFLAKTAAVL